jgi:hypothetical protein
VLAISMKASCVAQLPARVREPDVSAVDLRDRYPRILLPSRATRSPGRQKPRDRLQNAEREGIREMFSEMLATSVWAGGDGGM